MNIFSTLKAIHGSDSAAARAIGLSRQHYHQMKRKGRIPAKHYRATVAASQGQIEYEDLVPK